MTETKTEQLKIDGILMVPEGTDIDKFRFEFRNQFVTWQGNISPLNPDAESFMVEIERKVLEDYRNANKAYQELIYNLQESASENDKAYSDLAEQLKRKNEAFSLLDEMYAKRLAIITRQSDKIAALELRLKVKDSPIKAGLKSIWKWFKGLVGK